MLVLSSGAKLRRIRDWGGGGAHNPILPAERFPLSFVTVFLWSTDTPKILSTSLIRNLWQVSRHEVLIGAGEFGDGGVSDREVRGETNNRVWETCLQEI